MRWGVGGDFSDCLRLQWDFGGGGEVLCKAGMMELFNNLSLDFSN